MPVRPERSQTLLITRDHHDGRRQAASGFLSRTTMSAWWVLKPGRTTCRKVSAVRDEDGCIFIVDRKKDMIIAGGFNIYPRDIDEVLFQHPIAS